MDQPEFQAVFSYLSDGGLRAGPVVYSDGRFSVKGDTSLASVRELRSGKERKKVLLFDAESLSGRRFNPRFVERVRVSGADVWLAETVVDAADIADGFLANISKLVIPVHTVGSYSVFEDAMDVSDDCVPMIAVRNSLSEGEEPDVLRLTDRLVRTGYRNIVVFDTDGSLDEGYWYTLRDKCPGVIPYSPLSGVEGGVIVRDVFPFSSARRDP